MAATRRLVMFHARFDLDDKLIEFSAEMSTDSGIAIPDGHGGEKALQESQTFHKRKEELPATFVTAINSLAGKVRTRVDADYPLP